MDAEALEKLKNWVELHPEDADVRQMNLSTKREFTIRQVLDQAIEAEMRGIVLLDNEMLEVHDQIEHWIREL